MKTIDYFKISNKYAALIVAFPPEQIQKQIDRLMKKWIAAVWALSAAKSARTKKKWKNYLNKITAERQKRNFKRKRLTKAKNRGKIIP